MIINGYVSMSFDRSRKIGVLYALAAFGFWGFVPIYFKAIDHVSPQEVLCHRVIWSVPLVALMITLLRDWKNLHTGLRSIRILGTLFVSAVLLAVNWFIFIYAVSTSRILQVSLGYYINPLVSVLLGIVFLKERLRPLQAVAVLLAAGGTINLTIHYGRFPWIALGLALTFAFYGLIRKTVRIESVNGIFVETILIAPFALAFLLWQAQKGDVAFGTVDWQTTTLLVLAGAVTAFPLIWFTSGARRLQLSTIGILQYLGPSLMFILAVFFYGEAFGLISSITFALIWIALAIFVLDTMVLKPRGEVPRPSR